jgi:vacuolar-type H+-ATPase subunit H
MTETMGTPSGGSSDTSTRDIAKDEARGVAQDAVQGGKQTVETAKEQAGQVAGEAVNHVRTLVEQARGEITGQGSAQKERAATGLRSLADELTGLVEGNGTSSSALSGLATQASDTVRQAADWLESREPADVLEDVRRFARRRPGMFLLGAAAIGLVGGRLTRSLAEEARDDSGSATVTTGRGYTTGTPSASVGTGYVETGTAGTGYSGGAAAPLTTPPVTSGPGVATGVTATADYPDEAPGTPGYGIPPTGDTRGDATADFAPNSPDTGLGEASTDQMPSEFGARGTNASGNRTEEGGLR